MAVGQHRWYHFGVGAPPILVYCGDWDVHWGYGVLTQTHLVCVFRVPARMMVFLLVALLKGKKGVPSRKIDKGLA